MDQYGVIGNPITHSLSPFIHQQFAQQTQQDLSYVRIQAPFEAFKQTVMDFKARGGKGLNVTVPFKTDAYRLADLSSKWVKLAEAANTLCFREDGSVFADNTDGIGLINDLVDNHRCRLRDKRILILGAGGAVRTILNQVLAQMPISVTIANRTAGRAMALANTFKGKGTIIGVGLSELSSEPYDLIINATSAGLTEGDPLRLPDGLVTSSTWCYDLMYGSKAPGFLSWAAGQGAFRCLDGIGMLVEQAAASFYLWRGVYPDTQSVIQAIRARS